MTFSPTPLPNSPPKVKFMMIYRTIFGVFILIALTSIGLLSVHAESSVEFITDEIEGSIIAMEKGTGNKTKEPIAVTIKNNLNSDVTITFCALPKDENVCTGEKAVVEIVEESSSKVDSIQLLGGQIRTLKLNLIFRANEQSTSDKEEHPKDQTGLLIIRVDGIDTSVIPFTLTPFIDIGNNSIFDKLTTGWVINGSFVFAGIAILIAILTVIIAEGMPLRALVSLRMGVAEWKLEDSWAVNLSLAIAILSGIRGILPESLDKFKITIESMIFLFGVLTALAAFLYNATTRPGPIKEEGKQTYMKQGLTGVFLLSSFFVVWSLMGQLGLQVMVIERLRDSSSEIIPKLFLLIFEVGLVGIVIFVFWHTWKKLVATILDQKVEEHKKAYEQRGVYLKKFKAIESLASEWQMKIEKSQKKLLDQEIKEIKGRFGEIVMDDKIVTGDKENPTPEYFIALFKDNLPMLLDRVAADSPKATIKLFKSIKRDSSDAIDLLRQTLPAEDAVAIYYSSLWAPLDLRKKSYKNTMEKISRHFKVACAQARSNVEPDRVLGQNEELYTNLTKTLDELDKAFGQTGNTDPIYTNLKKLFVKAKAKWEILNIQDLQQHLCSLDQKIDECRDGLDRLYQSHSPLGDTGIELPLSLKPFADALDEIIYYPELFPVDTKALDIIRSEDGSVINAEKEYKLAIRKQVKVAFPDDKFKLFHLTSNIREGSNKEVKDTRENFQNKINETVNSGKAGVYSVADDKSKSERAKALRDNGIMKVVGEKVQML